MVVGELAACAASELAENLAEELGVRLVKKEAASIAVAFLTTEALKVCLILDSALIPVILLFLQNLIARCTAVFGPLITL